MSINEFRIRRRLFKSTLPFTKESDEVTTNSIAEFLEMKPSSVTDMLKKLSEKNYINYQKI